jgi:hypothetical protein
LTNQIEEEKLKEKIDQMKTKLEKEKKNRKKDILTILIIILAGFILTTILLAANREDPFLLILLSIFDIVFISSFFFTIYLYLKSDKQPIQKGKMSRKDWRFSIAVIGTFILLLASIVMIILLGTQILELPYIFQLALIIIFGVITLLSSLVIASVVLTVLNLANPNESLGLPAGSVRAIIALMLILIFAIMSIFMYQYLNDPVTTHKITIESFTNSTSGNQTIIESTETIRGTSEAMIDFAKQTLTTLSTLVVALAAFYFGTRSVAQAQKTQATVSLTITPDSPFELKLDDMEKIDPIKVVTIPKNELVEFSIEGDLKGNINRSSTPNEFSYEP